jgi:hypothetical protein
MLHEQRNRLCVPVPVTDQFQHFYWPAGAPWREMKALNDRVIPPGGHACPVDGCLAVFDSRDRLTIHVRVFHALGRSV